MPPYTYGSMLSRSARNSHLGLQLRGLGDGSAPVGFRGEARLRIWGQSPPAAEAVCRHLLQILTVKTIKIWKFRTIHLLILDQYVSRWKVKRHFWAPKYALLRTFCRPTGSLFFKPTCARVMAVAASKSIQHRISAFNVNWYHEDGNLMAKLAQSLATVLH